MLTDDFSNYLKEKGKAENTIHSYVRTIAAYSAWYQESMGDELQKLYRANILDYVSYLRTVKQLSNGSVNSKLAALCSFNEYLISSGIQSGIALSKQDYLKVQQKFANPSTISKKEVEEFRQKILVMRGKRDYAIVTLMAYAGLRISEALNLQPSDINIAAREVLIRAGKGDKQRVVFLNDKIINAVQEYLRERKSDCPYLFASRNGSRLDRSAVNRVFNENSDHITPHTLRHYFCSAALEAGYSIAEVANQAGHSNVHTTLIYTNPTRQKMKEKANLL